MDIFECINKYAENNGEKVAVSDGETDISYIRLSRLININQKRLRENGYQSGENIIIKTHKQIEFVIAFLSLLAYECWLVPVPYDVTDAELGKIIELTDGKVMNDISILMKIEEINDLEKIIIKPNHEKSGILHMTSGSTGEPKFCIRTLKSLESESVSFIQTFSIIANDKLLSCSPLYHSYAMGGAILPSLMSGGSLYVINKFVPRQVLRVVEKYHITFLFVVPIMAKILCDIYTKETYDTSSLRIVLVGAGLITEELFQNFYKKYNVYLMSNYGSTETGGLISRIDALPFQSVGKAMYGTKIKLCDEYGQVVKNGEVGEIYVKTDGMFLGYYKNGEKPFDAEGFFPMGDLAVCDDQKNFYLVGRKKLLINVSGKKVNPLEVEKTIMELDSVYECVVVGVKKNNGDETIKAFVVAESVTTKEILKHCQNKLSKHKIPREIEFINAIPKNEVGKVDRNTLIKKEF